MCLQATLDFKKLSFRDLTYDYDPYQKWSSYKTWIIPAGDSVMEFERSYASCKKINCTNKLFYWSAWKARVLSLMHLAGTSVVIIAMHQKGFTSKNCLKKNPNQTFIESVASGLWDEVTTSIELAQKLLKAQSDIFHQTKTNHSKTQVGSISWILSHLYFPI